VATPTVRSLVLSVALLCSAATALAASPEPQPGDVVRILAPTVSALPIVGTLTAAGPSALTVGWQGLPDSQLVPRAAVDRLEVRRQRSRLRGALIGAGIGALAGAVAGYADCAIGGDDTRLLPPGRCAVFGAVVLAPLGAAIGLAVPPGHGWSELDLGSVRVGAGTTSGGSRSVRLSLRF